MPDSLTPIARPPFPLRWQPVLTETPQAIQPVLPRGDVAATLARAETMEAYHYALDGLPDPATHIPPPSILQIRISQLLNQQSVAQATDDAPQGADETAAQDASATGPSPPAAKAEAARPEAPTAQGTAPRERPAEAAPAYGAPTSSPKTGKT